MFVHLHSCAEMRRRLPEAAPVGSDRVGGGNCKSVRTVYGASISI